ncbi:unnamed protein product [Adineta ricciae]|uniref:Cadherin domain-containing protein n=1 Tax=Adineta ricciae TaxID=249248 RepID=A0A814KLA2_ADIRI|nr:unnamed protein product [Adineta ricciae]CAF1053146.1 unnamed protein product [Adineta ricciae]
MLLHILFIISSIHATTFLRFEQKSYEIYISESTPIHTKIGLIKAIASPSVSIQYELHGDTNKMFYLHSLTGELILLSPVDYETMSMYQFTLEARSPSIATSSFSELIIHIVNINDNPPEINLVVYPSVIYDLNIIKYDQNSSSTPFATINIKDPDPSTNQLSLTLNDTEHFQIQLIRQFKTDITYILSTRNNSQLIHQDHYYLLLTSCDNDQPVLCTNQTYQFRMQSTEYLCNLSFQQKNYIIDIKESLPEKTLLMRKITNEFCGKIVYSLDENDKFSIDSRTGDLFVMKKLHRIEQSIYMLRLYVNNQFKVKIYVRILDQYGNIPFLMNKVLKINRNQFSSVHIFNSTFCRSQLVMEKYFQLLSNCTITSLVKPPRGRYLFNVALNQQANFQDTFVLELIDDDESVLLLNQSQWITLIPIVLSVLVAIGIIILGIIILKEKHCRFNQLCPRRKKASSVSSTSCSNDEKSRYNKYDSFVSASKLRVHDDYELSPSSASIPIYIIQKASPPVSSLSPGRDDEGYSGSSDVSENHLPFESNIISGNGLLEQYHIHEFPEHPSISSVYDIPRQYMNRINGLCISPDITLV